MMNLNVSFSYGKKKVFEHFSAHFEEGAVYGLLGVNGAGKSTLLYLMSGLLRPSEGEVMYKGDNVLCRRPDQLSDLFLVPEEFFLPNVKLSEYVKLMEPFYPRFSRDTLTSCLQGFHMDTDLHLGQLSMGEKKKAYMCFALATNTRLLLMDEPSNGLDIPSKSLFRSVVAKGMADDRTIVISTHQVRDVESLLDRIMIVDHSQLLLDERVDHLSRCFAFEERALTENLDDVLFSQPSVAGHTVMCRKESDEEMPLNLEVLFNAIVTEKEKVTGLLKKEL